MTGIITGREIHPVLPLLDPEVEKAWLETDKSKVDEFYSLRAEALRMEQFDPFRYGYEPEIWKIADRHRAELRKLTPKGVIHEVNLGGNRSSKTERAAKRMMQYLCDHPGAQAWACDSTQAQSRQNQQRLMWKYFPPEWKNKETGKLKRDAITKVTYTQAGGFTEDTFVLPNGSQCWFKYYSMDVEDLEGPELDIVWADELVPVDWIDTLVYRLVTRNGLMHVTFTPKTGYTQTVGRYVEGSRIIEEEKHELLPIKDARGAVVDRKAMPRIRFCHDKKARIVYFFTNDNPYGNYEAMKEEVSGKPEHEVMMRVCGETTKAAHAQFPLFRPSAHVIPMNRFEAFEREYPNASRYMLVDPCSGRNWFMLWTFHYAPKKVIVYREWPPGDENAYIPGVGPPGPWAIPGKKADGEKGPAQEPFGLGLDLYKTEILRVENGEDIFERWMDSRYGNSPKTEREGTTTLVEQMADLDMDFRAMTAEKSIVGNNDGSLDMINTALRYDIETAIGEFSPKLARINEPNLLVTENCANLIYSLEHWTGKDKGDGACKDPIDCLRGLFLSECDYVDDKLLAVRQPWLRQFGKIAA